MKVIFDDVTYNVLLSDEFESEYTFRRNYYLFSEVIQELLTNKQYELYIRIDTQRVFEVNNKKIESFKNKYENYKQ